MGVLRLTIFRQGLFLLILINSLQVFSLAGLFPKIRKLKSMNKNDEEFDRYIEAKVKRDRLRREREQTKAASATKASVTGVPSLVRRLTPLDLNSVRFNAAGIAVL